MTNVWDRTFTGTRNRYLRDIVERTGGGFAAVGDDGDAWLLLTDANGQNPVNTYYNTNGKGFIQMRTIKKTSDGGYIMVGRTTTGSAYDEDYYVVKTTSNGTQSWAYRYDNSGRRDIATSVEEDASGNFWIFGRSQKLGVKNTKIWIVKVNSSGVYQTSYEIGDTNNAHTYVARGSIKLSSGNFLIIGYTNVSSGRGYHGYIAEINTSGKVQGTPLTIGASPTGWTENYLFDGVVSSNGNYYYICGTDNQAFSTAYDLWFLKLSTSDLSVQNTTPCQKVTYYYDKDLDGYGNNNQWNEPTGYACFAMPGYVLTHNDPDDSDPSVTPR